MGYGLCFADRTSTATMRANQLRLWFARWAHRLIIWFFPIAVLALRSVCA